MLDFYSEFKDYATKHMGISSVQFHYWENLQSTLYNNTQVMNIISSFCQINLNLDTSGIVDLNLYRNRIFS